MGPRQTQGVSPKVSRPAWTEAAIGVVLLVLYVIMGEDTLLPLALASLGASGVTGLLGYNAPPSTQK